MSKGLEKYSKKLNYKGGSRNRFKLKLHNIYSKAPISYKQANINCITAALKIKWDNNCIRNMKSKPYKPTRSCFSTC